MNPTQVTTEQIQERVQELVASLEQYAKLTLTQAMLRTPRAVEELAAITSSLATELATLLGKGRLEVSRES